MTSNMQRNVIISNMRGDNTSNITTKQNKKNRFSRKQYKKTHKCEEEHLHSVNKEEHIKLKQDSNNIFIDLTNAIGNNENNDSQLSTTEAVKEQSIDLENKNEEKDCCFSAKKSSIGNIISKKPISSTYCDLDVLVEETESGVEENGLVNTLNKTRIKSFVNDKNELLSQESLISKDIGDLKGVELKTTSIINHAKYINQEIVKDKCNGHEEDYLSTGTWQTLTSKSSVKNAYTFPNRPNSSFISRSSQELDKDENLRPKSCVPVKFHRSIRRKSSPSLLPKFETDNWIFKNMSSHKSSKEESKICNSLKITKKELEYYLPRKSFFSCHDRALKEAGQDMEDPHGIRARKKRLLEMLQQKKESDKFYPTISQTFDNGEKGQGTLVASDDAYQSKQVIKKATKSSKKKGHVDEDVSVEYQPLLIYLKYISEHPEEYMVKRKHFVQENLVHIEPSDSLVKLGSIFQRGQHGSSASSLLLNAVHDIRPRFCDPGLWTKTTNEKALMSLVASSGKKDNSKPDTPSHTNAEKQDDLPKSEFEQKKWRMEEWLKTVNAAQLNRAKELALADLGEEDIALSKWWLSLKTCNYIRNSSNQGMDRVCV